MRIVLTCLLALVLSSRPAQAAWAIDVAWASTFDATSGGTIAFTYGSAVASGSMLVCFVTGGHVANGVVTGVEDDSANGSWTQFGQESPETGSLGGALSGWYFLNSTAATPVVTATFTAAVINRGIACGSYTGIRTASAFDVGAGNDQTDPGTGTDAITTGATGSTAEANELAVAGMLTQFAVTVTTGTGFTQRLNTAMGGVYKVQIEDQNVASPGAVTATWTVNNASADTQALVGVFKEPAAAGGCTGGFLLWRVGKCD